MFGYGCTERTKLTVLPFGVGELTVRLLPTGVGKDAGREKARCSKSFETQALPFRHGFRISEGPASFEGGDFVLDSWGV